MKEWTELGLKTEDLGDSLFQHFVTDKGCVVPPPSLNFWQEMEWELITPTQIIGVFEECVIWNVYSSVWFIVDMW